MTRDKAGERATDQARQGFQGEPKRRTSAKAVQLNKHQKVSKIAEPEPV